MIKRKEAIGSAIKGAPKKAGEILSKGRETAFERFPLLFTFLGTFGFVATLYGLERMLDRVNIFTENPLILFLAGVVTLVLTGSLYKRLQ